MQRSDGSLFYCFLSIFLYGSKLGRWLQGTQEHPFTRVRIYQTYSNIFHQICRSPQVPQVPLKKPESWTHKATGTGWSHPSSRTWPWRWYMQQQQSYFLFLPLLYKNIRNREEPKAVGGGPLSTAWNLFWPTCTVYLRKQIKSLGVRKGAELPEQTKMSEKGDGRGEES